MNILLINHCSTNKGDKAVLEFMLHELAVYGVKSITVSANEPTCSQGVRLPEAVQIQFVPWGWNVAGNRHPGIIGRVIQRARREFYLRSYSVVRRSLINDKNLKILSFFCNKSFYRALKASDVVISVGGHHVTSILSPDAVSPQTFEMALALLAGKPLYLWSQSIGPLVFADNYNCLFVRNIISRSTAIYVREKHSLLELNMLGFDNSLAFSTYETVLGYSVMLDNIIKPSERFPIVGISVYSVQYRTDNEKEEYIQALRLTVDHITASGYRVIFFPMQMSQEPGDDRPCIDAVMSAARQPEMCSIYTERESMIEHIEEVSKCRVFIGHKTHSVIIALITGTPILAIVYHQKTKEFMSQYGLAINCIDDRQLRSSELINMFERLKANIDSISLTQIKKSNELGERVRQDFNDMLNRADSSWRAPRKNI